MEIAAHIVLADASAASEREAQRLEALHSYAIYGTASEPAFNGFTQWLSSSLNVPSVVISFVGEDRVTIKSAFGFPQRDLTRQESFCRYTIESERLLLVPDSLEDPRFRDSPLVRGENGIRFYAAAPLITADGWCIGAVCAMDSRLHPGFGEREASTLREIARAVMRELESRRKVGDLLFMQQMNTLIAGASDFLSALNIVLYRAGLRLRASYCIALQQNENLEAYSVVSTVAILPAFEPFAATGRDATLWTMDEFKSKAVLTEQRVVDTGALTAETIANYGKFGNAAFALGMRRQIAVPLDLGIRHAALMVGFNRSHVAAADQAFLMDLVAQLVPLLRGRLREEELQRSRIHMRFAQRAMRTLVGASEALTHAKTQGELLQAICEVAVLQGGYAGAWVGFAENDSAQSIRIAAKFGHKMHGLADMKPTWADNKYGRGISGTAIRENRVATIHDIAADQRGEAFRHFPMFEKLGSGIALPLCNATGKVVGVFTLYNAVRAAPAIADNMSFAVEEEALLTELARNLINGMDVLNARMERNEARIVQQASDARFAVLMASNPTVLFALECQPSGWDCVEITPNFERVFGYPLEEAKKKGWWDAHLHPDDMLMTRHAMRQVIKGHRQDIEFRLAAPAKPRGYLWIRAEMEFYPATAGTAARIMGAWFDVTEKHEAQTEIHQLAYYDQLTKLGNRELLHREIEKLSRGTKRNGFYNALMFLDLDRFKAINDAYGHTTGDKVLKAISKILQRGLRKTDIVVRLGGDEFVVLLPQLAGNHEETTAQARLVAEKIINAVDRPIKIGGLSLQLTASVGIHVFSGHYQSMEQILRCADMAMYSAKSLTKKQGWPSGRSKISVFEFAMQDMMTKYQAIQSEMKAALAENRFELWLQPQVDSGGIVSGAEGLIRLRRADNTLIPPNDFISAAEETGIIVPIGQWVRAEAYRLLVRFPPARLPRLSVNISALELLQPAIVKEIADALARDNIDPARLTLEVTENLLVDRLDETIKKLEQLGDMGIGISIDDFGTGYSCLAYLQHLPVTELKIDNRFVTNMLVDKRSAGLIQSIITLARNLGFSIVAEGVETAAQADFLRRHGCHYMQGYLFGRARPAMEFNETHEAEDAIRHIGPAGPVLRQIK